MNHHGVEGIAESEAASHAVSFVRKQREMTAAAELLFSSPFSQGPHLVALPSSGSSLEMSSQVYPAVTLPNESKYGQTGNEDGPSQL